MIFSPQANLLRKFDCNIIIILENVGHHPPPYSGTAQLFITEGGVLSGGQDHVCCGSDWLLTKNSKII